MSSLQLLPYKNSTRGTVLVPGSKSITNRCLLLSALAEGECKLANGLKSDDTEVMIDALRTIGIQIDIKNDDWSIRGKGGKFQKGDYELYLGNAGTAMRFLTAAGGLVQGSVHLIGKERMYKRPIHDLLNALHQLGAPVESEHKTGYPPIKIIGEGIVPGGLCEISGKVSSQFLSAILLLAPQTEKGVHMRILPPLVSRPYLDMTISLLNTYGVKLQKISELEYFISRQKILPTTLEIEGDASSAAHVFSLAIAAKGEITIPNFPEKSIQGDAKYLEVLEKFGATIHSSKTGTTVSMKKNPNALGEINFEDMPDVSLAAATLSVLAKGKTKLTGLSTLRKKECDRIEAIASNLGKMGADVKTGDDYIEIHGDPAVLHGAEIKTFDDHRIAMSFAALGSRIPGVVIHDPTCVNKTFPGFWKTYEALR